MDKIQVASKTNKPFKGVIPVVKSFLFGDSYNDGEQNYVDVSGQNLFYQILSGSHTFKRKALAYLVETGYVHNPACFGIINKILLAQRNIVFTPYWGGKPYITKIKDFNLDLNFGLQMLLLTGTCIVYEKEIVGFPSERKILNTLDIEETCVGKKFSYRLNNNDGTYEKLDADKMNFIKIFDPIKKNTQMGLSPLQAALMPIESLKEMYVADTSTLKNKGVDVMITNDSDSPMVGVEQTDMDKALNERISGARRSGGVATSTSKLRAINLGRTTKELALWDGYKIKTRDLCTALQVDSGLFNDPDNKKFDNVTEANKALYNDCVIPYTRLITENKQLIKDLGYYLFLDVSGIDCLQEGQKARAEKAKTITEAIVGLNSQVKAGTISAEIAIKILVSEWGFDPEEAKGFIMPAPTLPPNGAE